MPVGFFYRALIALYRGHLAKNLIPVYHLFCNTIIAYDPVPAFADFKDPVQNILSVPALEQNDIVFLWLFCVLLDYYYISTLTDQWAHAKAAGRVHNVPRLVQHSGKSVVILHIVFPMLSELLFLIVYSISYSC